MIFGIGTDIVEVQRIKSSIENYGERFLGRIFTDYEREYCEIYGEKKYLHYAARFASKEAFSKAIGTGITKGFKFKEVGIKNLPSGKPELILEGTMQEKYGSYNHFVTLSHTDGNAIATIVIEENNIK
jgi:holo-[acyl-carrier protein] synthase